MANLPFGAELRHGYPEASACACSIDGQARPARALRLRSMNFGQHWRAPGVVEVRYVVELPRTSDRPLRGEHPPL